MAVTPTPAPSSRRATVRQWLAEPLAADVKAAIERIASADDVAHVAVMSDVHLSHEVCVGTVVATRRLIYPNAVGGDVGCGMAAVAFDCPADVLDSPAAAGRVLAALYRAVPVNRHARAAPLPDGLEDTALSDARLCAVRRRNGRVQFGTLGRGNHFLEFQRDEADRLWAMVHTGSRATGQAVRDFHLARATRGPTGLYSLDAETDAGRAYLADMEWARAYAAASRRAIVAAVASVVESTLGARAAEGAAIACDHNHVRREIHFGESFWVHRKGATSAAEGEAGIIPGSMGSPSFHTAGRGHPDALCSSSHGAGRAMSRTDARNAVSAGRLRRELHGVWFDHRLAERLREEAPSAYKDVAAVMRAQKPLTRIVRKLRPVLSYKGG